MNKLIQNWLLAIKKHWRKPMVSIPFLLILCLTVQFWFRTPSVPEVKKVTKTRVVTKKKAAPVVKLEQLPDKPKKLEVYTKPDTVRRQAMEKGTLVSGVKLQNKKLVVHRISPKGITEVSTFTAKDLPSLAIAIDSAGQVNVQLDPKEARRQRRKRVWRKIGNGVVVVAAFVAGVLLVN
ncbi:hypothetical protein HUW51_17145 [Adhaeribacter swui]|uniref:Uncharacterized protein n=1 Tax=Adhaeribacter swui TaxID=2086471 RepID=A0A7G7GB30_9BACT|nr:hypothetical protein [Adhaeribacter swui]QNF34364.1 hypothetical protein HUW51_17145 [Adhaeribacter swui]